MIAGEEGSVIDVRASSWLGGVVMLDEIMHKVAGDMTGDGVFPTLVADRGPSRQTLDGRILPEQLVAVSNVNI
jgi:hypothetical protein